MTVSRSELFTTLRSDSAGNASGSSKLIVTVAANFPWLSKVAASWERVMWHKCHFTWRPFVGTTSDGSVAYGPDYSFKGTTDRAFVTSLSPVADHPLYLSTEGRSLVIPTAMLQSRKWYLTTSSTVTDVAESAPFNLAINAKGGPATKDLGELWIHYTLTLSGPTKA